VWRGEVYPRPVDAILAIVIVNPTWMKLRNVEWMLRRIFFDDRKEMSTGDTTMTTFKAGANLKVILTNRYKPASYWTKFPGGIVLVVSSNLVNNDRSSFIWKNNI
jgi:hypothetical protein